jgi:hypothetical protein
MTVTAAVGLARPRRWPAALAWALWLLVMVGLGTAVWLDHLLHQAGRSDLRVLSAFAIAPTLACVSAATVGAVLASRRPRHPVGWLLLGFALALMPGGVTAGYLAYGVLARPGALPATTTVARYYPAMSVAAVTLLGFVLLLTPTGSLPSPCWRWWARASAAAPIALLLVVTVAPGSLDPRYQAGVGGPLDFRGLGGALLVANQLALVVATLAVVVDAGSLVVRFRRARGVERQQLRWVALAAALVAPLIGVELAVVALGTPALLGWATTIGAAVLPLAVGAAILRYRLYDLDRIISRTLAYGLLTLLLGLGYAAVVLGFGRLLPQGSSLVVAAATLAAAAAFAPLRRRVQTLVDRRFNRRRYDAARTVDRFAVRLRDQVDLDALRAELLAVVDQTVQPTQASLWLRAPAATRPSP